MATFGKSCGWTPSPPNRARAPFKKPSQPRFEEGFIMPINPNADIEITAFRWVPEFAQGVVRDLRARWALEEAGLDYRVRLLDQQRPPEYLKEQPFDQVPILRDGDVQIFESGAIVQYIGGKSETLLPATDPERIRAIGW